MDFRDNYSSTNFSEIRWRLHLRSPPEIVHKAVSTGEGRVRFWAESADETDGTIRFKFIDGLSLKGKVIENRRPCLFVIEYFDKSLVTFQLEADGSGGTDLTLIDYRESKVFRAETCAGWLSVLLALKAAVDFDVDVRNHDPKRTWDQGFVDN